MDYTPLQQELRALAREKGAVILAHNYQRAEVQDAADYVGDSLGLSRQAAAAEAELIVFCGVDFMAETAYILAPHKRVIHPEPRAGCPMAAMVDPTGLAELRERHPDAVVVTYVNSSAAVKAISDICCTSANAVDVVRSVPAERPIIFAPDCNLGAWVARKTGREMILWEGYCPTHDLITPEDIAEARERWPGAKVVAHPECRLEVSLLADAVESTSGMVSFCRQDDAREYIIATEKGMIHRLEQDVPGKVFHLATDVTICPNMKMTTLRKVVEALRGEQPVVQVPEDVRVRALRAVQRMVEIGR
jgi:quinolinate synthase